MKAPRDPKHHNIAKKNKQTPQRHKKTQEETPLQHSIYTKKNRNVREIGGKNTPF